MTNGERMTIIINDWLKKAMKKRSTYYRFSREEFPQAERNPKGRDVEGSFGARLVKREVTGCGVVPVREQDEYAENPHKKGGTAIRRPLQIL